MHQKKVARNIFLYYLFQLFREPLFWGPILITYITSVSDMSLSEIYFMESVVLWILIILEIPSGALSDLIGRRKTILIGSCLLLVDSFLFSIADSSQMIWLANSCWAVGFSLVSGADSSLLFDSLKYLNRENEFKKIEGRSISYRLMLIAPCSVIAGYLASVNIHLPLYLSLIFILVNCLIVFLMSEPPVSEETKYGFRKHINLMKDSIFFVITNSKIIWIIGFVVLIQGISKVWFFSYNPYFELVDLPIIYFGWIFFLLNIVGAVSSYFADYISRKFGELGSIILIIVVISIPVFMMGSYVSKLACLLVLMPNVARGYLTPFISNLLHHYLDSKNRATVISIKSAVNSFGQFLFLVLFGLLFNIYSLPVCLEIMGFITAIGGVIFIITYFKIFKAVEI